MTAVVVVGCRSWESLHSRLAGTSREAPSECRVQYEVDDSVSGETPVCSPAQKSFQPLRARAIVAARVRASGRKLAGIFFPVRI